MSEKRWKEMARNEAAGAGSKNVPAWVRKYPRRPRGRYPNVKDPSQLRYALLGWPPSGENRAARRSKKSRESGSQEA